MTALLAGRLPASAPPIRRYAGVFRRLEHRLDPTYGSVAVAVCGAMVKRIGPADVIESCPLCFPLEQSCPISTAHHAVSQRGR
ncbi:hypothetical protein [Actinoalloteichus hymeniacidonis]|uniref:Uncharacterized protein n=1 Tax=Actinoalloteichus hymeniacidonis TaxID=340345 RepID=A0AAC9MYK6_9PSEU|nr:hypothetical protein [Actinoalloteichus hymeniacidonis]AOS64453.1 hypothetical protein TL08_18290 [Actinoalloteichus hymeniacidonis]MBB5907477.1 hypothetical protein [Actinoalloteichus hymeniacidonis]